MGRRFCFILNERTMFMSSKDRNIMILKNRRPVSYFCQIRFKYKFASMLHKIT